MFLCVQVGVVLYCQSGQWSERVPLCVGWSSIVFSGPLVLSGVIVFLCLQVGVVFH